MSLFTRPEMKPLSYRRAFDLLVELENTGMIVSRHNSNGRYGYQKYYLLTDKFDLVGHLIDPNWWENLKDNVARAEIANEKAIEQYKLLQKLNRQ